MSSDGNAVGALIGGLAGIEDIGGMADIGGIADIDGTGSFGLNGMGAGEGLAETAGDAGR